MKLQSMIGLLQANPVTLNDPYIAFKEYLYVSCTDLMSDALAMICTNPAQTILLTGLANGQALRTAEMMDINVIILCRNKTLSEDNIDLATSMEMNVFTTALPMFEAVGLLYKEGLKTATRNDDQNL
jgi:energy-converting hydrogenase Eha subunit G